MRITYVVCTLAVLFLLHERWYAVTLSISYILLEEGRFGKDFWCGITSAWERTAMILAAGLITATAIAV